MFRRTVASLFFAGALALTGCDDRDVLGGKAPEAAPAAKRNDAARPAKSPAPAERPARVEQAAVTEAPAPAAERDADKPAPDPIHLSGKGDQVSDRFKLDSGLSTWKITHDGRSNVQVSLLNQEGKEVTMPLNEIGPFRGTLVVRVAKPGEYLLSVKADGKWTVTIEQPRPDEGAAKPFSRKGKGADLAAFVTLPKGLNVFKVTHQGDGVFRVKLFDRDGRLVEEPFARIGKYEGSKAVSLDKEGLYAVGVYANGNWTLKID